MKSFRLTTRATQCREDLLDAGIDIVTVQKLAGKTWEGWTVEEKKAIAAKIDSHADLLGYCLKTAREKLGDYCESSEDVRSLAITLYPIIQ